MIYRVYVYRTNEHGEELSCCFSRYFYSKEQALELVEKQKNKKYRKAVLTSYKK